MILGVVRESFPGERRVVLMPGRIASEVLVAAGVLAGFEGRAYVGQDAEGRELPGLPPAVPSGS